MDNKEVISTLNDLIEISKDGEEGFRTAAENVEVPPLKEYFLDRSQEVASSVNELQDLVRTLGGQPETEPSISGSMHRHWVNFKTALTSNDTVAVLNETERGEDVALATYRKAIEKELPQTVRSVVQRQLEGVQRNHDRVKQLRDAARAEAG